MGTRTSKAKQLFEATGDWLAYAEDLAEILADDRPLNELQGLICEATHEIATRNEVDLSPRTQRRYTAQDAQALFNRVEEHKHLTRNL